MSTHIHACTHMHTLAHTLCLGASGALRMSRSLLGREEMGWIPSEGRWGAKAETGCTEHVGKSGCVSVYITGWEEGPEMKVEPDFTGLEMLPAPYFRVDNGKLVWVHRQAMPLPGVGFRKTTLKSV